MAGTLSKVPEKDDVGCVHYWLIDSNNVGRCRKCGQVKDFGMLQAKEHEERLAAFFPRTKKKRKPVKVPSGTVRRGRPRKKGLCAG